MQTVRQRLGRANIKVMEAGVLTSDEDSRPAGSEYVLIACPSLDDCDIAEARLRPISSTGDAEWRRGWTPLGSSGLTIRVFDPAAA